MSQVIPQHDHGGIAMSISGTTSALYPQRSGTSPWGATTTIGDGDLYDRYAGSEAFQIKSHLVLDRLIMTRKPGSGDQDLLIEAAINNAGTVGWETVCQPYVSIDVGRWVPQAIELGIRLSSGDSTPVYGFRVTASSSTMQGILVWRQIL